MVGYLLPAGQVAVAGLGFGRASAEVKAVELAAVATVGVAVVVGPWKPVQWMVPSCSPVWVPL